MTLAIAVEFEHEIEPYSDEEGLVPGRVEDAGLDRRGTVVGEDLHTIYTTVRDAEVSPETMKKFVDLMHNGWECEPVQTIHKDINYLTGEALSAWLKSAGPVGEPVDGVRSISVVDFGNIEQETYYSAAIAHRKLGTEKGEAVWG